MREGSCFQNALADFTHEAASGGAIRHLADLGYTVEEIREELAFPTSCGKVQSTVWRHLSDTGVILSEEPGSGQASPKAVYVREYDSYGRPSFRRVPAAGDERRSGEGVWRDMTEEAEKLPALLREKIAENGEEYSYASCDFGVIAAGEPERLREMLQFLERRQRAYIEGLPWEKRRVFHRLLPPMADIVLRLHGAGMYEGICYFLKTRERMLLRDRSGQQPTAHPGAPGGSLRP